MGKLLELHSGGDLTATGSSIPKDFKEITPLTSV